jgi:hypothetical protein
MEPTNKLRFVRRSVPDRTFGENIARYQNILQQWWEEKQWAHDNWIVVGGEWRDIPIEEENT